MGNPLRIENIQEALIEVGNQQVLLDSDIAQICEVATRDINKAVSNNRIKFPDDYIVVLTTGEKTELVEKFHRFNKLIHSTVLPKAFPDKGLYMLVTILIERKR